MILMIDVYEYLTITVKVFSKPIFPFTSKYRVWNTSSALNTNWPSVHFKMFLKERGRSWICIEFILNLTIICLHTSIVKCIHNIYVIADKELNQATNQLLTKYQSANFLIFDDDMNSGATLKLVCDALQDKLDNSDNKIKCLVNGFSLNGR